MRLPARNGQPKYHQLKSLLVESIRRGEIPDGSFLPSEDELTRLHAVSRTTVRAALKELREEGVVVTRQGQPSRVRAAALAPAPSAPPMKIAWIDHGYIGMENPMYFEIFKAVSFHAEQHKLQVNFISLNNPACCEAFLAAADTYAGSIVTGVTNEMIPAAVYKKLETLDNLVCVDSIDSSPAKRLIGTDQYAGARKAVKYLLDTGHRDIVFLGVSMSFHTYSPFKERLRGYQDELRAQGVRAVPAQIVISDERSDYYDIRPLLEAALRRLPKTDAIFALTDHIAIDTVYALKALSYKVPFDISVVGFDGLAPGQNMSPKLTTICQPCEEIGRRAVEAIMNLCENPGLRMDNVLLQPELLVGASVYDRRA